MQKTPDTADVLIMLGLVLFGAGAYLQFGHGWALLGVGAILLAIGLFGGGT